MSPPTQRTGSNPVTLPDSVLAQDQVRYRRMGRTVRLTDQMLTYDIDTVAIVDSGEAPAWTEVEGDRITINAGAMPTPYSRGNIAVWLGTNAHEVFHSLYTPRSDTKLVRRVMAARQSISPTMWRSFNVLEDQRIERLGLARYGKWRGYLVAALTYHIKADDPMAWLLLAGRTWLPVEARDIARATFAHHFDEASADYAARLIGSYQRLSDPGDTEASEAYDIIAEFNEAFGSNAPRGTCGTRRATHGDEADSETPDTTECQYHAADEPEPEPEADDDEPDEGDEPDDEGDDGDDGDGDGDGSESDDDTDDDDADGGDASGDSGDESGDDADGDDEGGDDDGTGDTGDSDEPGEGTAKPDGVHRSLKAAMREATAEALDDDDTAADLDKVVDQVQHGTPGRLVDCRRTDGSYEEVTPAARLLARDVTNILVNIKDDNEAAWERRTDSGRFNVHRWATDPEWEPDIAFDHFHPGAMDASSLHCTLVLDVSASMSKQTHQLAEATWAIRTAVDRVEGECTVLGFGDDVSLMFPIGGRPDGRLFIPFLEGSTNPTPGVRVAHQLVTASDAANRIVIVMTDGQWWNAEPAEEAMQAARDAGALVALVGLGREAHRHVPKVKGADVTVCIDDSSELVPIFKDLAERSMLAAAGR